MFQASSMYLEERAAGSSSCFEAFEDPGQQKVLETVAEQCTLSNINSGQACLYVNSSFFFLSSIRNLGGEVVQW